MSSPDEPEQEVINHLQAYLAAESPLSATISALAEPIERAYTAGDIQTPQNPHGRSTEGRLWTLWYGILRLAKETLHTDSSAQNSLVRLLAALKARLNPPRPQNRTDLRSNWIWHGSGELWSDLIVFGPSVRETWNDIPVGRNQNMTAEQWTNLNAFVARVSAAGMRDFSLYAIWSMRGTLETDVAADPLDNLLPASAAWILYAGKQLYNSDQEWLPEPMKGDPASGGPLWDGKHGFCKERWAFWKKRFRDVEGRRDGVGRETKRIAAEAVAAMDAVESGS